MFNLTKLLIVIGVIAGSNPLVGASKHSLSPLINMEGKQSSSGLESLLADPVILQNALIDEASVGQLSEEIKIYKAELKSPQNTDKPYAFRKLFESYSALCYSLAILNVQQPGKSFDSKHKKCADNLAKHANEGRKTIQDESFKAEVDYHLMANQYILGRHQIAVRGMRALSKSRKLPERLATRIAVAEAIYEISQGVQLHSNIKNMVHRTNKFDGSALAALRLFIARSYAGLKMFSDQKIRSSDNKYRYHLNKMAEILATTDNHVQSRSLVEAYRIWRLAEGKKFDASRPPFNLQGQLANPAINYVIEQIALTELSRNNFDTAVGLYRQLASHLYQTKLEENVHIRIIEVDKIRYIKTKNPFALQSSLAEVEADSTLQSYAELKKFSKATAEFLIQQETKIGLAKSTSANRRNTAIQVLKGHVASLDKPGSKEKVVENIAEMHALNKEYGVASKLFAELAGRDSKDAMRLLDKAITYAHLDANYSSKVDWSRGAKIAKAHADTLIGLYQKKQQKQSSSAHISHIGLMLQASQGAESAVKYWIGESKNIEKTIDKHTQNIFGQIIKYYENNSEWDKALATLNHALKIKCRPLFYDKPVDVKALLAKLLLNDGKTKFANQDYKGAADSFKTFKKKYPNNKDYPVATYLLAQSLEKLNSYPEARKNYMEIVERFPQFSEHKNALYKTAEIAYKINEFEYAMKYLRQYITKYRSDNNTGDFVVKLKSIYLAKQMYAETLALNEFLLRNPGAQSADKSSLKEENLKIESEFGDNTRAVAKARRDFFDKSLTDSHRSYAGLVLAKDLLDKEQSSRSLHKIGKTMSTLDINQPDVAERYSEVLFYIAEKTQTGAEEEIVSSMVDNPRGKVAEIEKKFDALKNNYLYVCQGAPNGSFCAPAYYQLARRSEIYLDHIEDLSIVETLSKKEVDAFNKAKSQLQIKLLDTITFADAKANNTVGNSPTSTQWTSAIRLNKSRDIKDVDDTTEIGFIEWAVEK